MPRFDLRGVWGGTGSCGTTRDSVCRYLDELADLGVNAVFMGVKEGDGAICWPSERFPSAVKEPYRTFDLPEILIAEGRARGIEIHAWLIDFFEGEHGAPGRSHPEWSMLDAKGRTTCEEWLRGKRFGGRWMCPSQRPGYTDQWLIPLYVELAERYEFASLHHDYVRYPGDLAPDQYCFCDSCLEAIASWAGYRSRAYPEEAFTHPEYDREYLEAHWEPSPRVLPSDWRERSRAFKASFLLEGGFFPGGRADLDYFFYTFRVEQILRFVRECRASVSKANPQMKLSAAVFKNPIHSGRFIGQDWRRFGGAVDLAIPMNYRAHFPGNFEHYTTLLAESIVDQLTWSSTHESYACGVALNYLDPEGAEGPYDPATFHRIADSVSGAGSRGLVLFCDSMIQRFGLGSAVREAFAS